MLNMCCLYIIVNLGAYTCMYCLFGCLCSFAVVCCSLFIRACFSVYMYVYMMELEAPSTREIMNLCMFMFCDMFIKLSPPRESINSTT